MRNFLLLLVAAFLISSSSASPGFAPLACNANIESEECVPFSSIFSDSNPASLTIPCGKCVVMDYTDGSTVTVPGGLNVLGRLHFPPTANMVLRTTAVFVQGVWSMDTPADGNTVKVTLYGSEEQNFYPHSSCCESNGDINDVYGYDCPCSVPEGIGKKPFVVAGGRLDIKAIDETCPSWTKLKEVNASTMQSFKTDLAFANCLRPGDDLLVTSDAFNTAAHTTYTVDSVDETTGEIFLQEVMPRLFPSLAGPGEPEFAVEVALLRRDVIFDAELDPLEDWIGGHSIVYHTPNVVQTIQGVKFDNFGQEGILGRYPVHFHMSGFTASLVSKNVITNSHQRCVFIHDTDGVTIDDNVAFDTKGHCYATETGNERYNSFTYNLGAYNKRLTRTTTNNQSDKPGGHATSTFWIRNMENTFIGNVATGNVDTGYWLEMKDIYSNQLNAESFKDNSAHSNFRGLMTYKKGWKPKLPAVMENFKAYLNKEGLKFHITGNLTMKKALLADNTIGVRYGVWNDGVTFDDCLFIGLSEDRADRYSQTCPSDGHGIRASMNSSPTRPPLVLNDVVFKNYKCGTETLTFYSDTRQGDDMGRPVRAENITVIGSDYKNKPRLNGCNSKMQNWHMEDYDGTVGPDVTGPGFLIRDNDRMKAFLPDGSCEPLWYDGSGCTAFCEGACLRLMYLKPTGRVTKSNTDIDRLELTDFNTGKSFKFTTKDDGKAIVALPAGDYSGEFLDSNGVPVTIDTVAIWSYDEPRCSNFVTKQDFSFSNTFPPSAAPSAAPTITYDKSYKLSQTSAKCPWSDLRLFKNVPVASVEECRDRCFNMPTCNFFTYATIKQQCMGCGLSSEGQLSSAESDHTSYEMTSIKAPEDFGYDLWSGVDGLSPGKGKDMKCPWKGSDRIGKDFTTTRKGCYDLCKSTSGCTLFSWGEDHAASKDRGACLLCKSDLNLSGHTGVYSYSMVA